MPDVYVVQKDGKTVPMDRVLCKDEDKELQQLLEKNPQLMPGDQIKPDNPRRWLLIKREMPVPDPSSGEDRWSIDHFFVDQSAIPTFVECKRFLDTRSRREVVGQMLDYAANGHWYWDRETIRGFAAQTAKDGGMELEDALNQLQPDDALGVDEFLERIENNLRQGQVRMVFFMEEAPHELKSIVDFLNKQMERADILIVEAKQFQCDGLRVVAPYLFGYSEEARRVKKVVTVSSSARRQWDKEMFFEDAQARLKPEEVAALRQLLHFAQEHSLQVRWGGGKAAGSFSLVNDKLGTRSFFSVFSNGMLSCNFGYVEGSPEADEFRSSLEKILRTDLGLRMPEDIKNKFPGWKASEWASKVEVLCARLGNLIGSRV